MPAPKWLSTRLAVTMAALIAAASFLAGQIGEGWGASLAIGASAFWVAYSISRQRRLERQPPGSAA